VAEGGSEVSMTRDFALVTFPRIKKILQKRFKYVFVDEMQDMDKNQYEVLEQIFFDGGNSQSFYQRIGDQNQAIFGGGINLKPVWEGRAKTLTLRGSCRLTEENSRVVKYFAMKETEIDGRGKNIDGTTAVQNKLKRVFGMG
jgi:DNA helicase II / ATP-dependent DNA helicase PcrA